MADAGFGGAAGVAAGIHCYWRSGGEAVEAGQIVAGYGTTATGGLALLGLAYAALVVKSSLTLLSLARFKTITPTNAATAGIVFRVVLNIRRGECASGELIFVIVDGGLIAADFIVRRCLL
jgi:hypothetical protein